MSLLEVEYHKLNPLVNKKVLEDVSLFFDSVEEKTFRKLDGSVARVVNTNYHNGVPAFRILPNNEIIFDKNVWDSSDKSNPEEVDFLSFTVSGFLYDYIIVGDPGFDIFIKTDTTNYHNITRNIYSKRWQLLIKPSQAYLSDPTAPTSISLSRIYLLFKIEI